MDSLKVGTTNPAGNKSLQVNFSSLVTEKEIDMYIKEILACNFQLRTKLSIRSLEYAGAILGIQD